MTRAEALAIVAADLTTPLADAGVAATDASGALKEPLDRALRQLGYGTDELATAEPDDDAGFLALATWQTLRTIWWRLGDRFDLTLGATGLKLNQGFGNVEKLLKDAEANVIRHFGGIPSGGDAGGFVALDLNFLEAGR